MPSGWSLQREEEDLGPPEALLSSFRPWLVPDLALWPRLYALCPGPRDHPCAPLTVRFGHLRSRYKPWSPAPPPSCISTS